MSFRKQVIRSLRLCHAEPVAGLRLILALAAAPAVAAGQSLLPAQLPDHEQADVAVQGYVYEPARVEPTEETTRQLRVPTGFQVTVFARGLGKARMLAVGDRNGLTAPRRCD